MIRLQREPDDPGEPLEKCCFCRVETPFWTQLSGRKPGQQVACCESCASRAEENDVPSKREWCRRESIATKPTPASECRRVATMIAERYGDAE